MFKLHVIQAEFGDSLLIEFGQQEARYILIDGGPAGVYDASLRRELARLVGEKGMLELLLVSHVDMDHIQGILDLLAELQSQQDNGADLFLQVKELWMNSFSATLDRDDTLAVRMNDVFSTAAQNGVLMPEAGIAIQGVKEGDKVTRMCRLLNIPLNSQARNGLFLGDPAQPDVTYENLTFRITGPTQANLDALKKDWDAWLAKQEAAVAKGTFEVFAMSDRSVPNLSSLTCLVSGEGRTMLFTGDGRGDHLLAGLEQKGLLKEGRIHVEVLKVAHHGSDRNTDKAFFEKVTADIYVISANGKYGNPDYDTLVWIVEAAHSQQRNIRLVITNETETTRQLAASHPEMQYGYSTVCIPAGAYSIEI